MKVLFLNLASNNSTPDAEACVALVSEDKTVVYTPVDHRIGDSGIIPLLEGSLKQAGWDYKDLTHIACIAGPGGFTSLRMAVSLANVLADQLQIPACGMHLSELYAARRPETGDRRPESLIWLHSTKKTELFVRTFGIAESPWTEPTLISMDDLVRVWHANPLQSISWAGELIPDHLALISELRPAALHLITDILPSFLASQAYSTALLQPWYGRGW